MDLGGGGGGGGAAVVVGAVVVGAVVVQLAACAENCASRVARTHNATFFCRPETLPRTRDSRTHVYSVRFQCYRGHIHTDASRR